MRRISPKYAKPEMVVESPVYDNFGNILLEANTKLNKACLELLINDEVAEIFLNDWRVTDVVVEPLISPELEGKATQTLLRLIIENQGKTSITASNVEQVLTTMNAVTQELALDSKGEAAVAGIVSQENYMYIQSAKVAALSLLMGKRLGYNTFDLTNLGMAALLKDVGYIAIPQEILQRPDLLAEKELLKIRQHPTFGYELLNQHDATGGEVANAVLQHHERWNGTGYPHGLKGTDISRFAQIIAIADTYTALLSKRPGRKIHTSCEAIEYIMAYGGVQFNPELAESFVRQVPCYPPGLTVKLNTKEIGIVSDPNLGFIGRPITRIIYDEDQGKAKRPYDIDLSKADYQHKLITEVLDYY